MKRWYAGIIALDVVMLVIPTRWMGWRVEFHVALTLAVATGVLWCLLRLGHEDHG